MVRVTHYANKIQKDRFSKCTLVIKQCYFFFFGKVLYFVGFQLVLSY